MIAWFESIWPFVVHAGGGASLIAGLLAAAYFSPIFKKDFVWGAVVVAAALFVYGVGVHDEAKSRDVRDAQIVKTVHAAVKAAIESGAKDPYDDPNL